MRHWIPADQLLISARPWGRAGGGHECAHSDVDAQATLHRLDDGPGDSRLPANACNKSGPVLGTLDADGRKLEVPSSLVPLTTT